MRRVTGNQECAPDDRGVSPQVGFVLLIGIVFLGVAIIAIAGMGLLDTLESESEAEITYSAIDTTEHGIETVVSTGQTQSIPWESATYRDDGEVRIIWYNETEGVEAGHESVEIESLGAIEYELSDRTIAYQGGGTWEQRDDRYSVRTAPTVNYDGEFLQLRFVKIDEDDIQGRDGAVVDPNQNGNVSADITNASEEAMSKGYNDLVFAVSSHYHDGWNDHIGTEFEGYENATINPSGPITEIGGDENAIGVLIKNATETKPPDFVVTEDHGVTTSQFSDKNWFIDDESILRFEADIENVGDERQTQNVRLDIFGENGSVIANDSNQTELDGGDEKSVGFEFDADDRSALTPGTVYEYDVLTEDDHLDENGSFYYAKQEEPYLNITNPVVDGTDAGAEPVELSGENATIEVDITNFGATNITEAKENAESLTLSLEADDHPDEDPYEIEDQSPQITQRNAGETVTATWNISRESLLTGVHEFGVSAENGDETTGYFDESDGVDVEDTEVYLEPGTEVNISIIGSELSSHNNPFLGQAYNRWLPTYVDVYTQRVDEDGNAIDAPVRHDESDGLDWADTNLNRHDQRLDIFEYSFTTEERVSLMLQSTSYLDCTNWQRGQDYIDGYRIDDCATGDEYNELVDLTAETGIEESNVRVLNETRNVMPELDPGVDVQMRTDELLERDEVGIDVYEDENGIGHLDLAENETIFLFEITHHPEQYNQGPTLDPGTEWTNERYWNEAFERQGGDPNFNDVIAHVEFDREEPEEYEATGPFADGDSEPIAIGRPGSGSSQDPHEGSDGGSIDVGTDEVIIG